MVVLGILLEMRGQLLDALRQYGNLHLRRASIRVMDGYLLNDLLFLGFGNHVTSIARQ